MQTPLEQLVNANVFDILGASPAADVRALRRRLEEVRLEQTMGIAEVSEEHLRDAERALTDPRRLDEFRLTARWANEPALAEMAFAHDDAVDRAAGLRTASMDDALDCIWPLLKTCGEPRTWEVLGRPFGTAEAYGRAAVSLGAAALTAALTEPSRFAGAQTLPRLLSATIWPLDELGSAVSAEITASAEAWVAHAADWRLENPPSTAERESAIRAFGLITNEAVEFQKVLAANPERFGNGASLSAEVATRVKALARAIAIPLFNANRFTEARVVESGVLRLTHPRADMEELRDSLRITDLAIARRDVSLAIDREDWPAAEAALDRVAEHTSDPEEREHALAMARQAGFRKPAVAGAQGIAPGESAMSKIKKAPSLWTWFGIGVAMSGSKAIPGQPGIAISNWYFTVLWIPLVPLRRYVVRPTGEGSWSFLGRLRFRRTDWVHLAVGLVAISIGVGWLIASGNSNDDTSASASSTGSANETYIQPTARPPAKLPTLVPTAVPEPRAGNCVSFSGGNVRVVSCGSFNSSRVLAVRRSSRSSFPSGSLMEAEASRLCPDLTASYIAPTRDGWAEGDRTILCLDK